MTDRSLHIRTAIALQNKPTMKNRSIVGVLRYARDEQSAMDGAARAGRPIVANDWRFADEVMAGNERLGIESYTFFDSLYPGFLKEVNDAPAIIHSRGDHSLMGNLPGVAVVGTRKASDNGAEIARRLGQFLAEQGWVVVSGLALGVDAAAHRGALDGDGQTVAVLASGLDKATPKKNEALAMEILERRGAWISEQPLGVPALRHHFVPRNRIQVGLSAGSIIVEAEERSGSISQANFCIEIGRPLFAVMPENDRNELGLNCSGTSFLVREKGAYPIRTRADYGQMQTILDAYKLRLRGQRL